jgi:hypothetical protein
MPEHLGDIAEFVGLEPVHCGIVLRKQVTVALCPLLLQLQKEKNKA